MQLLAKRLGHWESVLQCPAQSFSSSNPHYQQSNSTTSVKSIINIGATLIERLSEFTFTVDSISEDRRISSLPLQFHRLVCLRATAHFYSFTHSIIVWPRPHAVSNFAESLIDHVYLLLIITTFTNHAQVLCSFTFFGFFVDHVHLLYSSYSCTVYSRVCLGTLLISYDYTHQPIFDHSWSFVCPSTSFVGHTCLEQFTYKYTSVSVVRSQ